MVLNTKGGPNDDNINADAPIVISDNHKEFFKQPYFYAFGHFSKFFEPDSIRVQTSVDHVNTDIRTIAFLRPDNLIALLIFNK